MYDVVDVIAHEYEFGNGEHMAALRSQVDWFLYQAGMLSFRAFAQGKATWILNYSWDGQKGVTAPEPMKNLANSMSWPERTSGTLQGIRWPGRTMRATRKTDFRVDRKKRTGTIFAADLHFIRWVFISLRRAVTTPRNNFFHRIVAWQSCSSSNTGRCRLSLQHTRGVSWQTLVLPSVSMLNDAERQSLKVFVDQGGRLVVLGEDASGIHAVSQKIVSR